MNAMNAIQFFSSFCCIFLVTAFRFQDVTNSVGIQRPFGKRLKYGGAVVADLDGDGWQDIIIGHHDHFSSDIYFNQMNGKFLRAPWSYWRDIHAFNPFHRSPRSRRMSFISSIGGNNGNKPNSPELFDVTTNRTFSSGEKINFAAGRGRTAIPLSLRTSLSFMTDVLFINAPKKGTQRYFAGSISESSQFGKSTLEGLGALSNSFGTVADVNMDGRMELVSFHDLTIHRVVGNFKLLDITGSVLPNNIDRRGTISVVELDFDNDGKMDLFVSRSGTGDLKWVRGSIGDNPADYLLRNVGGKYIDVSKKSLIPTKGESRGATAGDFNNDGWVDLLVSQYTGQDRMLLNKGDGTFREVPPGYKKESTTRGDHPVSVDYNRDGKLDIILSEGDWFKKDHGGLMRILKNVGNDGNWILVRVGSSPKGRSTSLHALVTVKTPSSSMIRRVGSPGTTTGNSYIELVHFGLGKTSNIETVSVRWTDGSLSSMKNIKAGRIVVFGNI